MDAFHALAGGAKFNKKKHNESINLFQTKGSSKKQDLALDLFGTNKKSESESESSSNSDSDSNASESETESNQKINVEKNNKKLKQDEINSLRNRLKIKLTGPSPLLPPSVTFSNMNFSSSIKEILLTNIEKSYWKEPTPIQMQAIPCILNGNDIIGCAPTGSGKTAAYLLPVLSKLRQPIKDNGVRALFLAPTKELLDQIAREFFRLSEGRKFKICNLNNKNIVNSIRNEGRSSFLHYDVLFATPLRLLSLLREGLIDLSKVEMLVMDEADKLLEFDSGKVAYDEESENEENLEKNNEEEENSDDNDVESDDNEEGEDSKNSKKRNHSHKNKLNKEDEKRIRTSFLKQIDTILSHCNLNNSDSSVKLQKILFSATINSFIEELSLNFLSSPYKVFIDNKNTTNKIKQSLLYCSKESGKLIALRDIFTKGFKPPVIIFLQDINRVKELYKELVYDSYPVEMISSNMNYKKREDIIKRFRLGEIWILICTDLMARGIDFYGVNLVINYDFPVSGSNYIHRIGRTGRGDREGEAITFFTDADFKSLRMIANIIKLSGGQVSDWMLNMKQLTTREKKKLRHSAPHRFHINTSLPPSK